MIYVANPDFLIVEPLNSIRIVDNVKDYLIMNGNTVLYHYSSLKKAKSSIEKLIKIYQPIIIKTESEYNLNDEDISYLKENCGDSIFANEEVKIERIGNDVIYIFPSEEELENVGK